MVEPGSGSPTWRFPSAFWIANGVELLERAAYYGTFIALTLYLSRVVGLDDAQAGIVAAVFAALIYLLPFFTGAASDRMGFRAALMLAFALLALGYGMLGAFQTLGPVLCALLLVAIGGAFVKPIITGTVAKCSDSASRARAFSLFYMTVNIGSFSGKTVVKWIRQDLGVENVPYFSAALAFAALIAVAVFYRPKSDGSAAPKSVSETLRGMGTALANGRFTALILITAGFWAIQGQLYASMPKYVLRLVGESAAPEWYANVNPLVVVLLVVPITNLIRRMSSEVSISIALALIPLSALSIALSPHLSGAIASLGIGIHPITVMMIVGIAIQGLAECFLSPKYLEYASKQAPQGQEGLYLGYAHLNTFFAWLFGFVAGGLLLQKYVPDPERLTDAARAQWERAMAGQDVLPPAYAQAHHLWYAFALIGVLSFAALMVYIGITRRADRRRLAAHP
ncbi:MAG: peptide MFS transporter [Acidobacteria bacterium]|nr:peptide MFS transporter [Acidobacteriota bacterium]